MAKGEDALDGAGPGGEAVGRRELLGALVGGAVVATASGCGRPPPREPNAAWNGKLDHGAAEDFLVSVDKRLAWIDEQTMPDDLAPLSKLAKIDGAAEEIAQKTELTRKAMRALYVTGRFIDLPDEFKAHPGVQARAAAMQSDMDDAVLGMTSMLENMTAEDHRRVRDHLRDNPDLGERIARYVERPGVEDGVPFGRRREVRAGILELSRRMRAQSPALVTDPLVRKVRRIQSRPMSEQSRLISARMGEEAFWAHQEKMQSIYETWLDELGPEGVMRVTAGASGYLGVAPPGQAGAAQPSPPAAGAAPAPRPGRFGPDPSHPPPKTPSGARERTIKTGGVVLGFGAGSVLLGLLFFGLAAGEENALFYLGAFFGVTIGPILIIVGLIILLVGAFMSASKPEPEPEPEPKPEPKRG